MTQTERVGLVVTQLIFWIIFMVRSLSYLNSMSDIVYKKNTKILVQTITFNIIVFNQQK